MSHLKLVVIGESGVGKTSFVTNYVDGKFPQKVFSTIGIDYQSKKIMHDNQEITLKIWDTAGNEKYRSLSRSYCRGAHAIIVVYDVNKPPSFEKGYQLAAELKNTSVLHPNCPFIFVGNKIDNTLNCDSFSPRELEFPHFLVSAKTGQGIDECFLGIIDIATNSEIFHKNKDIILLTESKIYSPAATWSCCW